MQQTSVNTGAGCTACDEVALVFYGKACSEQHKEGASESGKAFRECEHLKNCEGMRIAPP